MSKKENRFSTKFFSKERKFLFILGSIFLAFSFLWNFNQTIQLSFFTPKITPVKNYYSTPKEIIIPQVNIRLISEETNISDERWGISKKGASHLSTSARPGENGTIIYYGHNTNDRFGPIRWLSKNAAIKIKTQDEKVHEYKVTETKTVSPKQMDIFLKNKGESLA